MIRLFELEATGVFIGLSLCTRSSSVPIKEPRRLAGTVDRPAVDVLAMTTEDTERVEDIGATKEVAKCSDKFTAGLMTDVGSAFSVNGAVPTGRGMKRLTM